MESAKVLFVVGNTYGFAQVVKFKNKKPLPTAKNEEIMFHVNKGWAIKEGAKTPKFNYKKRIETMPAAGNFIIFVREVRGKNKSNNHRDTAIVWGLRGPYKKAWENINLRKKQEEKQQKFNRSLKIIRAEKYQEDGEMRKAL